MGKESAEKSNSKAVKKSVAPKKNASKFFKDMKSELKKVTWPNRKELTSYTVAVIVFCLIMAAVIGVVDYGLTRLMNIIIVK